MADLVFNSLVDTEKWARQFARGLKRPVLVLLEGEMGAGKTQVVKWMVESLGGTPASSPTFAVHQSYEAAAGAIDHADLYRLENAADLESTGFWDLFEAPQAMIFVEWADRIKIELWPHKIPKIRIQISKMSSTAEARKISIEN